jgi:hypothetical protein
MPPAQDEPPSILLNQPHHLATIFTTLPAANAGVYFRDLLPEPLQQLIPPLRRACLQPAAVLQVRPAAARLHGWSCAAFAGDR